MCNAHYLHLRRYGTPYRTSAEPGLIKKHSYEYGPYRSMKNRCLCSTDKNYPRWGGRGIKICDRWLGPNGFKNFVSDMGDRPPNTTLDRINNSGNYEPENCRWASAWEQAANTRRMQGRTPGVYYKKDRNKWCANIKKGKMRLTKSCSTEAEAIAQRKKWENDYLSCKQDGANATLEG